MSRRIKYVERRVRVFACRGRDYRRMLRKLGILLIILLTNAAQYAWRPEPKVVYIQPPPPVRVPLTPITTVPTPSASSIEVDVEQPAAESD